MEMTRPKLHRALCPQKTPAVANPACLGVKRLSGPTTRSRSIHTKAFTLQSCSMPICQSRARNWEQLWPISKNPWWHGVKQWSIFQKCHFPRGPRISILKKFHCFAIKNEPSVGFVLDTLQQNKEILCSKFAERYFQIAKECWLLSEGFHTFIKINVWFSPGELH